MAHFLTPFSHPGCIKIKRGHCRKSFCFVTTDTKRKLTWVAKEVSLAGGGGGGGGMHEVCCRTIIATEQFHVYTILKDYKETSVKGSVLLNLEGQVLKNMENYYKSKR